MALSFLLHQIWWLSAWTECNFRLPSFKWAYCLGVITALLFE
jgi:hypothetical protein